MPSAIVTAVEALITPVVEAQGVELYHLEYLTEQGEKVLRLSIEKEGGIGLDDCERVSRAVEPVLDAHDPIPSAYVLQVSSPGIERKLIKDSHYTRYAGRKVELKLYKALEGQKSQKKFRGQLVGLAQGEVEIIPEGQTEEQVTKRFPKEALAYCRLVYEE